MLRRTGPSNGSTSEPPQGERAAKATKPPEIPQVRLCFELSVPLSVWQLRMVFGNRIARQSVGKSFAMPAQYDKLGIHFQYPDNWTLDEIEARDNRNSVSVYSPGGAFWSLTIHPPDVSPQDLADDALAAMRQEYDELDAEPVAETIAGRELVGWDMNFYCLDLTNTAVVRGFSTPEAAYLIFCQADDREFDEIQRIFAAITFSLLSVVL